MAGTDVMEPRSIEDREARIAEIDQRLAELEEEWADRPMDDQARAEWNELNAERDLQAAAVEELRKRRQRLQQLVNNPYATERARPESPAFIPSRGVDIYDLTRIRAQARSEEDHRQLLHDNAMRALERAHFPVYAGSRERVQEHVEDLLARCDDERGTLAKRLLATGSPVYDRAFGKLLLRGPMALTAEEQRALSVGTDSEGGFAVPFQLDPTIILTNDGSISPLRQIARVETIVGKAWQGVTSSGITVTRSAEGTEAADNSFTIAQPEVSPTRVIADVRFSVEIDQDWPQMRSEISRLLQDAKDREEDFSFVMGDGTGNNPSGVVATLQSSSLVDVGTTGSLSVTDLYNLEAALPVRHRSRGRFLANKSTYQDVRNLGTGSDGGELWVRLASGQPSELLGYPAHEASAMPSQGTNARFLLFGDFSEFLIVDRLGMTVEVNPHVVGANGRWTGQRAVVAVWRNSSLILNHNAFRALTDDGA
jgi:HK97 family phage major capsid protein